MSRIRRAAAIAVVALTSSCSLQKDVLPDFTTMQTPEVTAAPAGAGGALDAKAEEPVEGCVAHAVHPGEYLTEGNEGRLMQQLGLVDRLGQGVEPLSFSTFNTGGEIIEHARTDPWYAAAVAGAVLAAESGDRVDATEVLAAPTPELQPCGDDTVQSRDARRHLIDARTISNFFLQNVVEKADMERIDQPAQIAARTIVDLAAIISEDLDSLP